MIRFAAAAVAAPVLDPTAQILLTVFGAALVTALAGFAGAWLQGRREHARWVRERRYDAYVSAMQVAERWRHLRAMGNETLSSLKAEEATEEERRLAHSRLGEHIKAAGVLRAEVSDAAAPLELLGPTSVVDAFNAMTDAFGSDDESASVETNEAFIRAMRKTLRIKS